MNLIAEFFENENYLSYWYEDVDLNFFDNLNEEIENLTLQGQVAFKIKEITKKEKDLVLYYSGHAISYEGKNYILPTDIKTNYLTFQEARPNLISIDKLIKKFSVFFQGTMIIILDSCRTKPTNDSTELNKLNNGLFFKSVKNEFYFSGSNYGGLSPIDAGPNKLIVFASEAGKPALFSPSKSTSFFTEGFLEAISLYSDEDIEGQILRARRIVSKNTKGKQIPTSYSSLINKYFINENIN